MNNRNLNPERSQIKIMLKKIITSLSFIIISFEAAYTLDLAVGAKASYFNWTPYIQDYGQRFPSTGWQYIENVQGIMAGPGISVCPADNVDLSVWYLYGTTCSQYQASNLDSADSAVHYNYSGVMKTRRHDLDCMLNFQIIDAFKLSAGFKYQPVKIYLKDSGIWTLEGSGEMIRGFAEIKHKFEQKNYMPVLGAGYRFDLTDSLGFNMNVSGLYIRSITSVSRHTESYEAEMEEVNASDYSGEMSAHGWGVCTEPGFIITISGNAHVFIGYRFQYQSLTGKLRDKSSTREEVDMRDRLHACSIAVIYRIL